MSEPLRLRELLARLTQAEIRFVVVGGLAVNAWGYVRATRDVDLVPDPAPDNLAKLSELLEALNGKVDVDGKQLTSDAISVFLRTGDRTLVLTDLGRVDVMQGLPQIPSFAALDTEAEVVDMEGLAVRVCSFEHLIAMKQASERPRDQDDLEALQVARGEAESEG